jgi:hypothetical protein
MKSLPGTGPMAGLGCEDLARWDTRHPRRQFDALAKAVLGERHHDHSRVAAGTRESCY